MMVPWWVFVVTLIVIVVAVTIWRIMSSYRRSGGMFDFGPTIEAAISLFVALLGVIAIMATFLIKGCIER